MIVKAKYKVIKSDTIQLQLPKEEMEKVINTSSGGYIYIDIKSNKTITPQQRKTIYGIITDIGKYTGYSKDEMKNIIKVNYVAFSGSNIFSLSNVDRDTANDLIRYCFDLCIKLDIPIRLSTYQSIDKDDYIIKQLLLHRQCIIDGGRADIHHLDAVGMGNNRNKIDNSQRELLPLCRRHHSEYHTIGHDKFMQKYHLTHGVKLNKEELKKLHIHA